MLLHPLALASLVALIVNDRWLKARWGTDPAWGVLTGKLSDVAGLVFFPLLVVSVAETVRYLCRGGASGWALGRPELAGAAMVTGVAFAAVQVVPSVGGAYAWSLSAVRWVPGALGAVLAGEQAPGMTPANHVMDATDTLCLPAVWLSYRIGRTGRDTEYVSGGGGVSGRGGVAGGEGG